MILHSERSTDRYAQLSKRESYRRRGLTIVLGLVALTGLGLGAKYGAQRFNENEKRYRAAQERQVKPKTDLELVETYVSQSKNPDLKTGEGRHLPQLEGITAVHQGVESQMASMPDPWLITLNNGHQYIYGEDAFPEPVIWKLEETLLCKMSSIHVRVANHIMGHDMQGGIAVRSNGAYLPNDLDWRSKCHEVVDPSTLDIPVAA